MTYDTINCTNYGTIHIYFIKYKVVTILVVKVVKSSYQLKLVVTILHKVAWNGHRDVIEILVGCGANINAKSNV